MSLGEIRREYDQARPRDHAARAKFITRNMQCRLYLALPVRNIGEQPLAKSLGRSKSLVVP